MLTSPSRIQPKQFSQIQPETRVRFQDIISYQTKTTPKHSTFITNKHRFSEINISPITTTNITFTVTSTSSPTKIPALMRINTSFPPRFCMSSSHTSSITILLLPSIPLIPSPPGRCRNSNNRDSWWEGGVGGATTIPITSKRNYHHYNKPCSHLHPAPFASTYLHPAPSTYI